MMQLFLKIMSEQLSAATAARREGKVPYPNLILMSILQHVVVQIDGCLIAMTDDWVKVESIRKAAYDGLS